MDWVIALLAVGCIFFATQIAIDYFRYRKTIEPKIERAEALKEDLKGRIHEAEGELGRNREGLEPIKDEVARLERDYADLSEEVRDETQRQGSNPRNPE
ncbi:MAG: hypothetical protein VX733_13955 [Candidatus Latescibacterota bacterium]|nr:hypothetical protein [Candidatus Latescibacterota bacterium]